MIRPVVYNWFENKTRKDWQTGRKGMRMKGRVLGEVEVRQEGWQDCSGELKQEVGGGGVVARAGTIVMGESF